MDVVIVHYHAAAATREAVTALRASHVPVHVLIADNGSTSDERALLESLGVTILDVGRNAGYAGAINAAFPHTRSDFIVVMNEDVLVEPDCLGTLRSVLASGAGVAGPTFYWDRDCTLLLPCTEERTRRNELVKAAGRRDLAWLEIARQSWRTHARRHWRSRNPLPSASLSGALLAFRRDTWSAIGPFDEGFHLYYEENDWLLRAQRAGLRPTYVPQARAIHLHNPEPSPAKQRWEAESFIRFGKRHYGERFMRRLLRACHGESVLPEWQASAPSEIPADAAGPLRMEVSPSPLGFPAAEGPLGASLPAVNVPLYVQIVDDAGRELIRYRAAATRLQGTNSCAPMSCIESRPVPQ